MYLGWKTSSVATVSKLGWSVFSFADSKSISKTETLSDRERLGAKFICEEVPELIGDGVEQFRVLQIATSFAFDSVDLADFFLQHFIGQTLLFIPFCENDVPAGTLTTSEIKKNKDVSHLFISFNVF